MRRFFDLFNPFDIAKFRSFSAVGEGANLTHSPTALNKLNFTIGQEKVKKIVDPFFLDQKGLNRLKKPSHATVPLRAKVLKFVKDFSGWVEGGE